MLRLTVECIELLQVESEVAVVTSIVVFEGVDWVVVHHLCPVRIQHAQLATTSKQTEDENVHSYLPTFLWHCICVCLFFLIELKFIQHNQYDRYRISGSAVTM